ncbi:hypothetical protein A1507_06500 [Methylomonas koyamae]|uniref:Uncharacterized protein n=1 Tax=Methylomonas koyamae TaxID=702114 RepID=A0A177NNQ2_9GAMM|nr:hypothetical protein A1507_06500 [Methylomonas koyamae]
MIGLLVFCYKKCFLQLEYGANLLFALYQFSLKATTILKFSALAGVYRLLIRRVGEICTENVSSPVEIQVK